MQKTLEEFGKVMGETFIITGWLAFALVVSGSLLNIFRVLVF